MSPGTGSPGLAELLELLKQRSGRSYTALAHRTGLSRSTLHRYCLGTTVPRAFGAVEKVARVCGADRDELDRLYRAWCQAIDAERAEGAGGPGSAGDADTDTDAGADADAHTDAHTDAESAESPGVAAGGEGAATSVPAPGPTHVPVPVPTPVPASGPPPVPASAPAPDAGRPGTPAPTAAVRAPTPLRAYFWLRVAALLLALVLPSTVLSVSYGGDGGGGGRGGPTGGPPSGARSEGTGETAGTAGTSGSDSAGDQQEVRGPDWHIAPQRVPGEFYGMNLSADTGQMPGLGTGSVRLWHSGTRWSQLEPRRGKFEWQTLDRLVEAAARKDLPVLLTLGGTPHWAAPEGARSVFADARAAPPDDLADWDRFIRALASRYRGRIEAYELWDYPSDPGVYSGSLPTLADMVERASRIIREEDPKAQTTCPSFGSLWQKRGRELLRKFIRTGAYEYCDVAALKLPPRRADGRPEEMVTLIKSVQRLFYSEGRGRTALWNTGPDEDVAIRKHLDARRARDYAVRFYLTGLYVKDQGLRRTYFYSWGSPDVPLVIQLAGGQPTEAARRVGRLRGWLEGAGITSCGNGARMGLDRGAYTCRFERGDKRLLVYWTTRGEADVRLGEGARVLRAMDGSEKPVRPGERLVFGEEPVLVEHRARKG
ncbi:helix-turn-helix domain-containing protein [Streptomyces iconiensis]|uniref:Helix-turn-helix domain-containing protein n=1 Tax=Streptomyces iconiensis TaxID=1384038 RepID=A0ABT7A6E5_9ACTN|nr:helix-turn-helix domain-containing protein [Streptomyces iconiensis]MDJ1136908.1 helix-turn-helix domain-containing protein [Streptomyces iconiensis]